MKHGGTTHRYALMHGAGRSFCCDSPANLAKYSWPAVEWQSNNTRPVFTHAAALFRTVWRCVIYPGLVHYAALHYVVAVGLVGHTCTELNYSSFGCDRPHGVGIGTTAGIANGSCSWVPEPLRPHLHICTHSVASCPKTTDLYHTLSLPSPIFREKKNQQKFQCGHRMRLCRIK